MLGSRKLKDTYIDRRFEHKENFYAVGLWLHLHLYFLELSGAF